jgi:glycosyltransferase 2 family protein
MSSRLRKIALNVLKYALLLAVLWYVVATMRAELAKADAADWAALKPNWLLMALAGLCLVGVNSVQMISYRSLLRAYGAAPTWQQMAAIAWIPPLGKYLPGRVWALLGAIAMLKRFAINVAVAVSVVIMLDAFSVLMGLIISSPLLMTESVSRIVPAGRWLGALFVACGIIALSPPVFGRVLTMGLRLLKRPPLERLPRWSEYATPIACAIAQWLFAGGALWLASRSITPVSASDYPRFVMTAACAMTISYLAIFTVAGLGVREAIFLAMLPPLIPEGPTGTITVVVIAMRLLQTIVEVVLAGFGALMLKRETRASGSRLPVPSQAEQAHRSL